MNAERTHFTCATLLALTGMIATIPVRDLATQDRAHWAYRAPVRPEVPEVRDKDWPRTPVDSFVLSRLEREGLAHAAPARNAVLLRRVYLDLIGLPPSVEAVDEFLADRSNDAYSRVVSRLLASERFGEHWARHWLDLARYADSNGFQADQLRDSWAYRDWVIDALNSDMPFDRFTIEQIAGDLVPGATLRQKIATGFHRTVTCNVEAGVHPEANRVQQVVDRVNTTATVWLGTTLSCAQCHDHKYDPFRQREYYEFFSYFNNTPTEVKNPLGDKGVRFDFYGPKIDLPLTEERKNRRADLNRRIARLKTLRAAAVRDAEARMPVWIRDTARALSGEGASGGIADRWHVLDIESFASTGDEDFEILPDKSVLVGGRIPGTTTYTFEVNTTLRDITAFKVETLTHPSLPGTGPGRGDDARPNFILSEFTVTARPRAAEAGSAQKVDLHSARADYSQKRWPVAAAIDGDQKKGWAIGGSFFKDHHAVFQTRHPVGRRPVEGTDQASEGTVLRFSLDQNYGRGRTIGRFRIAAYTGDPSVLALPEGIVKLLRKKRRRPREQKRLHDYYVKSQPDADRLESQIRDLQGRLDRVKPQTTLVMVEEPKPRVTRIMNRGDYLSPGAVVHPGTPSALHGWREEWPRNRLGLARWLVDPANPLVARVTVNRWWSQIFGRGLVATEEDFGTRGARPTHPQLLDWLAAELVSSGWSMKHVLRLIVTSATYRQSSRFAARDRADGGASTDPKNTLLARGPRFRMSAEMIRDSGLTASGLLSTRMGGPPVFPPQPDGLWRQTGRNEPKYVVATDENRFRRGIYVVWRRAAPYPSFVLFDGPDRSTCHPRRSRTNTPMQALALMNDEAYVEMAIALARRIVTEIGDSTRDRIDFGFRCVLARRPTREETSHLEAMVAREFRRLSDAPDKVQRLLSVGRGLRIDPNLDRVEVATWFFVATVLLNLDEAITKG